MLSKQQISILIRKLLFLPLILAFISCTVTKRLHRPGYHIQWKKIERTQKSQKVDDQKKDIEVYLSDETFNSSNEIQLELIKIKSINYAPTNVMPVRSIQKTPERNKDVPVLFSSKELSPKETTYSVDPSEITSNEHSIGQNTVPPLFWRTPAENLRKLGIAFMLVGGMLLFASFLVVFGAFSGNGGGAWFNFFLDLIDLSGWFWLLFFIVAFTLISYLFFLLVVHVLGGPLGGLMVGLAFLLLGIFLYALGKRRQVDI